MVWKYAPLPAMLILMDYKEAGVNIEEGYRAVGKYRELAEGTLGGLRGNVLNKIGSFAGMLSLAGFSAMEEPVLISGTDGVGTKLDVAFKMKKYDTVGIDCVAMCVNDILCHGAKPLFFLDYLACGKLDAEVAALLVKGVAVGCRETGCVLLGGETAEMPGFYGEGIYDIAGFACGIVDKKKIIDGKTIRSGDALVGIASSGPHSNGFSLIRRLFPDLYEDFGGMPVGRALLEPTRLYVRPVLSLLEKISVHGLAHITGGGFYENIPRMFPAPCFDAAIRSGSWQVPEIFEAIRKRLTTDHTDNTDGMQDVEKLMFNTFNMGIGMVVALSPSDVKAAVEHLDDAGFPAFEIGAVESGTGMVKIA
jgi:phosphoribosylformylglycinamidine cyclo-ligase